MQQPEQTAFSQSNNRKKVLWGIGILSLFPLLKFSLFSTKKTSKKPIACSPAQQAGTKKFLTQDGQLVEVPVTKINTSEKKKISDNELIAWIKK